MNAVHASFVEHRLLIHAPLGKDAALIESVVSKEAIRCHTCADLDEVLHELTLGAGALILVEESLVQNGEQLRIALSKQPHWSDIPVLLLTAPGAGSRTVARTLEWPCNVTLLERPVRIRALASAVRSALRARERQYQTRTHLEQQEQADKRKNQFLATLAHELRNPLAPISSGIQTLRLSCQPPPAAATLAVMDRQLNQLVRLVDDLMDISRITRGAIELRRDVMSLATAIDVAVETSRPLIEARGHTLQVLHATESQLVDGDATRLSQAIANLLNNAAKYTDIGGKLRLEVSQKDGYAVITISDNGVGISAADLPRVFDMFMQGQPTPDHFNSGLGIGLSLTRTLVEMHGGTITATSPGPHLGSQFTVRLPLVQAAETGPAQPAPQLALGDTIRILVVDDNEDAADSLAELLHILGSDVTVAYDGVTALQKMDALRPDVVILDLGMPGMDGYETARCIRNDVRHARTLLIAVTGWGEQAVTDRTQAAGFDHHFTKPVDIGEIQALVQAHLRQDFKRDPL